MASPARQLSPDDRAILLELVRRFDQPDLLEDLFPEQRDLILDPAKRKDALCSRRAGKTYGIIRYLGHVAQQFPGCRVGYITDTFGHAESLVWEPLKELDKEKGLGVKFHNTKLRATFPNGSVIQLSGCSNQKEVEKFLGHAYRLIVIDEGQSFPLYLKRLIREILGPAMADYSGTILVSGTPEPTCTSYFYEITEGKEAAQWSHHRWTVADNPRFPQWAGAKDWQEKAKAWLAAERKLYSYSEDDPAYLRDYKGIWARSVEEMIYSVPEAAIIPGAEVPKDLVYLLGIDLGFRDESAFVVGGYSEELGRLYEVENFSKPGLTLSEIVEAANRLIERYNPLSTVVDPARSGNALVAEINQRWGTGAKTATKKEKADAMTLLKSDLMSGKVFLLEDSRLAPQLRSLRWNKTFTREAEGIPCDLADAFLYLYRESFHWLSQPKEDKPEVGTPEYYVQEDKAKVEAEVAEYLEELQNQEVDFY